MLPPRITFAIVGIGLVVVPLIEGVMWLLK